jgi:hypothetical protein
VAAIAAARAPPAVAAAERSAFGTAPAKRIARHGKPIAIAVTVRGRFAVAKPPGLSIAVAAPIPELAS